MSEQRMKKDLWDSHCGLDSNGGSMDTWLWNSFFVCYSAVLETYKLYHADANEAKGPADGVLRVIEVEKPIRLPLLVLACAAVAAPTRSLQKERADLAIRDVIVVFCQKSVAELSAIVAWVGLTDGELDSAKPITIVLLGIFFLLLSPSLFVCKTVPSRTELVKKTHFLQKGREGERDQIASAAVGSIGLFFNISFFEAKGEKNKKNASLIKALFSP